MKLIFPTQAFADLGWRECVSHEGGRRRPCGARPHFKFEVSR